MERTTICSNSYPQLFSVCKKLSSKDETVHEFLKQIENLEDSHFYLKTVPKLFKKALENSRSEFQINKLSLTEMGKQVSLHLKTIISNATEVFEKKSDFSDYVILKSLDHFQFIFTYLGFHNTERDIEDTARDDGKRIKEKWHKVKHYDSHLRNIKKRFSIIEKRALKRFYSDTDKQFWVKYVKKKINYYAKEFFDSRSVEDLKNIYRESKIDLSKSCHSYWNNLLSTPSFSPCKKENLCTFYPNRKFDEESMILWEKVKKIQKRIDKGPTNLLEDLEIFLIEGEDFIEEKRTGTAKVFEVYAQSMVYLAQISSEKSLHLSQYLFVLENVKEALFRLSGKNLQMVRELENLKKQIEIWIKEGENYPFISLNPEGKISLRGISSKRDGLLKPVEDIQKLLFSKIRLSHPFILNSQSKILPERVEIKNKIEAQGSTENFSWSMVSAQGKKTSQEDDFVVANIKCLEGKEYHIFALMDGHVGRTGVDFVKKNLAVVYQLWINFALFEIKRNKIEDEKKKWSIFYNSLKLGSVDIHEALKNLSLNNQVNTSGTTLVMGLLDGNELWSVNVGDSRSILIENNTVEQLTLDAKPTDEFFLARIKERGGFVSKSCRLGGSLGMASSVGDFDIIGHSAEAQVTLKKLSGEQVTLILVSDGITDMISSRSMAKICAHKKDSLESARALVAEASRVDNRDNMTALVVKIPVQKDEN